MLSNLPSMEKPFELLVQAVNDKARIATANIAAVTILAFMNLSSIVIFSSLLIVSAQKIMNCFFVPRAGLEPARPFRVKGF